jgi:hypothetical protein
MDGMTTEHVSVRINCDAAAVYAYASDPWHLPEWAAGLTDASLSERDGRWVSQTPDGPITIDFTGPNPFGVLDHTVTLPNGETVYNPMRVVADGDGCEVIFTLRRQPEMTDAQFASDAAAVRADLERLRRIMER